MAILQNLRASQRLERCWAVLLGLTMSDAIKPLNTIEASQYLCLWERWHLKQTKKTLERYRCRGGGPEHFYIGADLPLRISSTEN
jgi:hypothetical protein